MEEKPETALEAPAAWHWDGSQAGPRAMRSETARKPAGVALLGAMSRVTLKGSEAGRAARPD